ncbi:hypothetical protein LX32DRAFT_657647 [Colletotrichum zoysiae]|uniref:Uncharacterized protein n=1 Tax=Colletotrichum zoysiae TaxID=1216348 RepID=A0AAD9H6W2_9PEZI|nr:hypothetical protein LX32DRAFT_657647 [Colletotrichum zoysiae]
MCKDGGVYLRDSRYVTPTLYEQMKSYRSAGGDPLQTPGLAKVWEKPDEPTDVEDEQETELQLAREKEAADQAQRRIAKPQTIDLTKVNPVTPGPGRTQDQSLVLANKQPSNAQFKGTAKCRKLVVAPALSSSNLDRFRNMFPRSVGVRIQLAGGIVVLYKSAEKLYAGLGAGVEETDVSVIPGWQAKSHADTSDRSCGRGRVGDRGTNVGVGARGIRVWFVMKESSLSEVDGTRSRTSNRV